MFQRKKCVRETGEEIEEKIKTKRREEARERIEIVRKMSVIDLYP